MTPARCAETVGLHVEAGPRRHPPAPLRPRLPYCGRRGLTTCRIVRDKTGHYWQREWTIARVRNTSTTRRGAITAMSSSHTAGRYSPSTSYGPPVSCDATARHHSTGNEWSR